MATHFCVQRLKRNRFKPGDFLKSLRTLVSQGFQRCFKPSCLSAGTKSIRRPEQFRFAAGCRFYPVANMSTQPGLNVGGMSYIVTVVGIQNIHVKLGTTQLGVAFL